MGQRRGSKDEADFGRVEAQASKKEAREATYTAGVAETEADFRAQVPGVCRFYCSQVWSETLKQAGVEASSDLWKAENVYYPLAICEAAPSSFEAEMAVEGTDTATNEEAEEAVVPTEAVTTTSDELAVEAGPLGVTETAKGPNEEASQDAANPSADAQAPLAGETAPSTAPLQTIPLSQGSEGPQATTNQLPTGGKKIRLKK